MAITLDDQRRAGIGTNGMNPNVIQVDDLSIRGLRQNAPPPPPPPQQQPQQRRGLLGGLFGPEGRDARARLAIGLEGLTMNPNQALIGQLQGGIEERKMDAERNRTLEYLSKLNTPEAARALQYAQATGDVVGALKMALTPKEETGRVLDAATLREMYPGAKIEDGLYSQKPDGTLTKVGGGGTNINMPGAATIGTIPPGYEVIKDANGNNVLRLIPGGPAATEAGLVETQNASLAAAAGDSIALIDSVMSNPNLGAVTGMIQGRLPPLTQGGTDLVSKIDQMQGQAFLTAFQSLQGGGAITDREGQAALNAVARLQRTQSQEAFQESLRELRTIIDRGKRRLEGQNIPESGGIEVGGPY
jgi:hypothetical protein